MEKRSLTSTEYDYDLEEASSRLDFIDRFCNRYWKSKCDLESANTSHASTCVMHPRISHDKVNMTNERRMPGAPKGKSGTHPRTHRGYLEHSVYIPKAGEITW